MLLRTRQRLCKAFANSKQAARLHCIRGKMTMHSRTTLLQSQARTYRIPKSTIVRVLNFWCPGLPHITRSILYLFACFLVECPTAPVSPYHRPSPPVAVLWRATPDPLQPCSDGEHPQTPCSRALESTPRPPAAARALESTQRAPSGPLQPRVLWRAPPGPLQPCSGEHPQTPCSRALESTLRAPPDPLTCSRALESTPRPPAAVLWRAPPGPLQPCSGEHPQAPCSRALDSTPRPPHLQPCSGEHPQTPCCSRALESTPRPPAAVLWRAPPDPPHLQPCSGEHPQTLPRPPAAVLWRAPPHQPSMSKTTPEHPHKFCSSH